MTLFLRLSAVACMHIYIFALTGHVNHRLTSSATTRARLLLETEENVYGLIYKTRLYSRVRSLFPRQ